MWDEIYHCPDYHYGKQANDFLQRVLPQLTVGKALSLAEGEGRNAVFLAKHGFEVLGVDVSDVGLKKARELAKVSGVAIDTKVADLADYTPQASTYDLLVSIWCHLPQTLRETVFKKAVDALKPAGYFVGVFYHPDQISYGTGGPKTTERLATLEELKNTLSELDWLIEEHVVTHIDEGKGHHGESSVIYLLGRKR